MRYVTAVVLAGLLIACGALFVRDTERSLKERIRTAIKEGQARGEMPSSIDAEQIELEGLDFGVELPASQQIRITIAYVLRAWRLVLVPAVILGSLGIAGLLGHLRP